MKLVEIIHIRCNEWGDRTYLYAPDEWTEDEIWEKISEAQDEYLDMLKEFVNMEPPDPLGKHYNPPYKDYPDMKVSEIQKMHEEAKEYYDKWNEERQKATSSFRHYLTEKGFFYPSDSMVPKVEINLDWGHLHGYPIEYDDPDKNTRPRVFLKSRD